jgi:hypothetical protein
VYCAGQEVKTQATSLKDTGNSRFQIQFAAPPCAAGNSSTLNPEPWTLDPEPWTLRSQTQTLNPEPQTRRCKLHPRVLLGQCGSRPGQYPDPPLHLQGDGDQLGDTSNPNPSTLNPKPSTLNPKP